MSPRRLKALRELLWQTCGKHDAPFLTMLDGIEDPYDFGSALRCTEGGRRALHHRAATGLGLLCFCRGKSVGRASEHLPMTAPQDLLEALEVAREPGIAVVGTDAGACRTCYDADSRGPVLITMDGERRGLGMRGSEKDATAS